MVESVHKKMSVRIVLYALFILLFFLLAFYSMDMFARQKGFSDTSAAETIACGNYYFSIDSNTVEYAEGVLRFELKNTLGDTLNIVVLESAYDIVFVDVKGLKSGDYTPMKVKINASTFINVYPEGCRDSNLQTIVLE